MLRRAPSLALRAAIIFMAVYAAVFLAVIALSAAASWADRGSGNRRGPVLALDYAAAELRQAGGAMQLPRQGRLADLAARNPAMWLMVVKDGRAFATGAVPPAAAGVVRAYAGAYDTVLFRLPDVVMPLGVVAVRRQEGPGAFLIAAGGVDPASLTTRESIDLLLDPAVVAALAGIAVISLVAMAVAIPFFSRAVRPITAEAGAIGPGDPGRRLDRHKAPRELLPLVEGFNAALDRLEVELGRRKRFVADVAHELRTPLAVMALQVEALPDAAGRADLRRGVRGLTHLVSQMLDLERLSLAGRQRAGMDLVAAARDVVADLAPMAIDRGYDLSLSAPPEPVVVTGDAHAVARAITNLVANAIQHGGGAGRIAVLVGADRTITVTDQGPGVPAPLQASLFEPFVRGDAGGGGCGLGLHLVREIMAAHGGAVCLVPGPGGATFRIAFPAP